jgi:hypothetical protein
VTGLPNTNAQERTGASAGRLRHGRVGPVGNPNLPERRRRDRWVARWAGAFATTAFSVWLLRQRSPSRRDDVLNRKAGELYRRLAEEVFGPGLSAEHADLGDETVTRLVIPVSGADIRTAVGNALERVSAIHARVEEIDPELAGRIVFDYSSRDGCPS